MKENNDKEYIEKLLSMEIERKMKTRTISEDTISKDEFISIVALSSGMLE